MTKTVAQLRGGILTQNSREDSSICKGHQFQKVVAALVTRSILTDKFRDLPINTHTHYYQGGIPLIEQCMQSL